MRDFSATMKEFDEARWKPGFAKVLERAGQAKLAAESARWALDRHMANHSCGSIAVAATASGDQLFF